MEEQYEIRIKGRLSKPVAARFARLRASVEPVETVLAGPVRDQAELHGLIELVHALGLELVELRRIPGGAH